MFDRDETEYMSYGRLMECGLRLAFIGVLAGLLYGARAFG